MPRRRPRRPPPDDVLLWMKANNATAADAAREFDIPSSTIRSWLHRKRVEEERCNARDADDNGDSGESTSTRRISKTGRVSLAGDDLDDEAAGLMRRAAMRLLRYLAGDLETAASDIDVDQLQLTQTQRRQLDLALALLGWSPRGAKEASIALGILTDKCPDILGLGDRIDSQGEVGAARAPGGVDATRRLRAALDRGDSGDG